MMKTKLLLLFVGLFSLVTLTSCSDDEEDKNVIPSIDVAGTPIASFFDTELPELHQRSGSTQGTKSFFYDPNLLGGTNIYENAVCVINSRLELANIYLGEKELPEIDFDKYTLILGQQIMPYHGFYVAKKELVAEDNGLVLNLYARNDARKDENLAAALQVLSFWGLYPKQTQKKITVKAIEEWPNQ